MSITNHTCVCNGCLINDNRSSFVQTSRESGTRYELSNPNRLVISKYIVDDCLLKNVNAERCDLLFLEKTKDKVIFVELKGSDVLKAVSQINNTINILGGDINGKELHGRIITSKVYAPDLRNNNYEKLFRQLKGQLITRNKFLSETI